MASRALPLTAALLVAALVALPLGAVAFRAGGLVGLGGPGGLGPADWAALRFTLWQAVLSALISVALAVPLARALVRRRFFGRGLLMALLGAPFILPVIVAVLGLLAVFGQNGILSRALVAFGFAPVQIYGLHGVVLAHVFFNLPLATRLIAGGWLALPAEQFRLAAGLNFTPLALFRVIEWPMLRRLVPGAFAVIFVICLSSFAVALTLGGGPRATTVELAIYQAFRFDFDLGRAATLALVQLALAGSAAVLAFALGAPEAARGGLDRVVARWDSHGATARVLDATVIGLAALFLLAPLGMIVARGVVWLPALPAPVWQAAGHSLMVAFGSTTLCLALALPLTSRAGEIVGLAGLALSPLVLGTGLFLLVQPWASPLALALPVTALVNALTALPFALRILRPEVEAIRSRYGALTAGLGLTGAAWWRRVALPRLRRPLGFAAGLAAALSMGDLGVIALFADPDRATLPLQMYRLMGAYRMEQAAGAALLLLALSLALFWIFDRGGRVDADA